ncbi:MAG TPA: hypothetical protein VFR78_18950 [Pyrinomonadaceae bacterium]|nr:hypothetical protein [Pyrinomonadaceae bacterium]
MQRIGPSVKQHLVTEIATVHFSSPPEVVHVSSQMQTVDQNSRDLMSWRT